MPGLDNVLLRPSVYGQQGGDNIKSYRYVE